MGVLAHHLEVMLQRKCAERPVSFLAQAEMALVSSNIVQARSVGNSASIRSNSARSTSGGGTGHAGFFSLRSSRKAASFSTSDSGSASMAASISASVLNQRNLAAYSLYRKRSGK